MGIKGLWTILEPTGKAVSLQQLAIQEGFIKNGGGRRGFRIGIDASGWIYRAMYRHGYTKSPELAALFARCARLLTAPIFPVFVFDGPGRPGTKRNKQVRGNDNWLVDDMKDMLDGFGFPWIQAPGEAEAQLAWMSAQLLIDAVLTDDSDVFVFGATSVLRILPEDNTLFTATLYTAEDTAHTLDLGLAELLLLAILVGGDYSVGLPGCGMTIAIALAKAGFGQRLAHAAASDDPSLIQHWRGDLVSHLLNNPDGHLSRKQPMLASIITDDFPDLEIIYLYQRPLINTQLTAAQVVQSHLNPVALAGFCERHFTWRTGILRHFASTIFPGLAMQELIEQAVALDTGSAHHPITPTYLGSIALERDSPTSPGLSELRIILNVDQALIDDICVAVTHASRVGTVPEQVESIRAWLPMVMVRQVFPDLVINHVLPDLYKTSLPSSSRSKILAALNSWDALGSVDIIEVSSSPEPEHPRPKDKSYSITVTQSASGQDILEFDTDSDGSV